MRILSLIALVAGIVLPVEASPRCSTGRCATKVRRPAVRPYVAPVVPGNVIQTVNIAPDGWRNAIIDGLVKAKENEAYLAALQLSGLARPLAYAGNYQLSIAGYQSSAAIYGDLNVSAQYQALARTVANAGELHGRAVDAHAELVGALGSQAARVATINALAAGSIPPAVKLEGSTVPVAPLPVEVPVTERRNRALPPMPPAPADEERADGPDPNRVMRSLVVQVDCLSCHNQTKKDGKLDLSGGFDALSDEAKASVRDRLTTTDESKLMPRTKEGGGRRLPADRLAPFLK